MGMKEKHPWYRYNPLSESKGNATAQRTALRPFSANLTIKTLGRCKEFLKCTLRVLLETLLFKISGEN